MTKEQMKAEKLYSVTMHIARLMQTDGLISDDEYNAFDTIMNNKYKPIFGTLLSKNDLIIS